MVKTHFEWLIDLNVEPSQSSAPGAPGDASIQWSHFLLRAKNFLSGGFPTGSSGLPLNRSGSWRVLASSNAVTSAYADLWVTGGDVVSASAGARSWILMQSPDDFPFTSSYIQLLINCDSLSTEVARFQFATNLNPFSSATISHTTSPNSPTNMYEPNITHRQLLENVPTFGFHTMNMWRSTKGDFMITVKANNSGRHDWGFIALQTVGGDKPDAYPVLVGAQRNAATQGFFQRETVWAAQASGTLGAWSTGGIIGTTPQNNMNVCYPKFASNAEFTYNAAGSSVTGRMPVLPMDTYSRRSGDVFYRGRFPDFGYNAGTNINNVLESGSADVLRLSIGDVWVLTTGSQVFLNL